MRVSEPLVPQLAEDLHASPDEASIVFSAFVLAYGLAQLLWGPLGDRFGAFRMATLLTLATSLTVALSALARDLATLGALRFLGGLTLAGVIPLSLAFIGEVVRYEHRQTVLARYLIGQILGVMGGQLLGGAIGGLLGWRATFLFLGLWFLTAGLCLLFELRGRQVPRFRRSLPALRLYLGLFERPWARIVLAVVTLEGMLFFGSFVYAGAFLRSHYAISHLQVGILLALFGTGGLLFVLQAKRLVPALGETGLARIGGGSLMVAFAGLVMVRSVAVAGLCTLLMGCGFYMLHTTLQTHATQMAPEMRSVAVSSFAGCFFLSQALGTWLGGLVVRTSGYAPLFLVSAAGLALLGGVFGSLLRMQRSAERKRRK